MNNFERSWESFLGRYLFINGASNLVIKHVSHTFINLDNEIDFVLKLCFEIVWPVLWQSFATYK